MSGLSVTDGYMAFADKVYTKYKDKYQEMKDDYLEQGRNIGAIQKIHILDWQCFLAVNEKSL